MTLLTLLGFKEELPLDYMPNDPAERRTSSDIDRRREILERNERNIARYLAQPAAQQRYRLRLKIRAALGLR